MTTQKRIRPFDLVINLLLGALALITLYPFYNVLILSFSNITAISKHTPYMWFWAWDLEGYRTIVNDPYFFSSLGNTLFVTVATVLVRCRSNIRLDFFNSAPSSALTKNVAGVPLFSTDMIPAVPVP